MFDPTAFENMKVVLEGALYDLDLSGEIAIIDRNDWINTAKLSRKFEIIFQLTEDKRSSISAKIELEASLENFAAELLPSSFSEKLAGCVINLEFSYSHQHELVDYMNLEKILLNIWGDQRKIVQTVTSFPIQGEKKSISVAKVQFDRLIYEDQMDDLIEMIEFMIKTMDQFQALGDF